LVTNNHQEIKCNTSHRRRKVILTTHQLVGVAAEWWENYQDAANEPEAITWQEFMEKFHEYHIPKEIMEIKAEEFCS
jgi:hypothetical protein